MSQSSKSLRLFWAKVDKSPHAKGCWLWTGCTIKDGYGQLGRGREFFLAHRFAYIVTRGPIPSGIKVLHTCDNPPCVNPAHLFLGTQRDNILDMVAKGRGGHPRGESVSTAVLSKRQVARIRIRCASGATTHGQLAKEYGVCRSTISTLNRGETWKHLPR